MTVARAASAGVWSAADIVLRQVVQFGATVVLARLLAPADFGLVALLGFFSSLAIVFVQGGLSLALVQRQETSFEEENAVFWTNFCSAVLFALVLIAIAPAVARFYGYPLLDPLMFVAAAQVVFSALGAVHASLLTRALEFRGLTKAGIGSTLASAGSAVAAAYAGWGVWALGVQIVVQAALNSAALWWVSPWRPRWRVRFGAVRDLWAFGIHISMSSILEVVYTNGFVLIIGKIYGARDLGYLNRATAMQALPTGIVSAVIARIALPLLATRADEPDALLRGFRMAVGLAMLLSLPVMAGLSVLADLVVLVLLGPQWAPAAPVLAVAAVGGTLLPLHVLNLQLLLAGGESRDFLRLEIQKKVVGTICYGVGCFFGIMGIAWASLVFTVLAFLINAEPTRRTLGYGAFSQIRDLAGLIGLTLAMAAAVAALRHAVPLPPIPLLALCVAAGGAIYIGGGLMLRLRAFGETLAMVRTLTGGGRS